MMVSLAYATPYSPQVIKVEGDIAEYQTYEKLAPGLYERTWSEGLVVYQIDPKSSHLNRFIQKAISFLTQKTNLRFREKTPEDYDFVFLTSNSKHGNKGCWSFVGRQGGKQDLNLSRGCENYLTIAHEILHSAGIYHEQSRPDRDDFIKIHWENIKKGAENNFRKLPMGHIHDHTPYDYKSIMHYGGRDFGINNKVTISKKESNFPLRKNLAGLTSYDVMGINALYPQTTPIIPTTPLFEDFEVKIDVEDGDEEYPYLFHFNPNFLSSHFQQIEKVTYNIPDLNFQDTMDTPPFNLSLYTDANSFPFVVEVHFTNGTKTRKEFKAEFSPKKSFNLEDVKLNFISKYKNNKYYFDVNITPGENNRDLISKLTVSLKNYAHETRFYEKNGQYSFRTYSRGHDLNLLIRYYLKNGDVISKEITLRPNIVTERDYSKEIKVKVFSKDRGYGQKAFQLKLEGHLEKVRSVHYDIHPTFGTHATYFSRNQYNRFKTPVYTTYARGWQTGKITITLKNGTQIEKEGVTIW
jgi:hypothetical protein